MLLWIANLFSAISPQTRLFTFRRKLYQAAGVDASSMTKICGTVRIHNTNVSIGEGSWIGAGVDIVATRRSAVLIGNNCDVGPGVMFVTGSHKLGTHSRRAGAGTGAAIDVGDGTWIGARSVFIAGANVGAGCMVAAGSVVRGTFPPDSLIAGVPARIVRNLGDVDSPELKE